MFQPLNFQSCTWTDRLKSADTDTEVPSQQKKRSRWFGEMIQFD